MTTVAPVTSTASAPLPSRRPGHRLLGLARAELTLLLRNRMQLFTAIVLPLAVPFLYLPLRNRGMSDALLVGALGSMAVMILLFVVYYNLLSTYVARREALVLKRLRTGEASDATVLAATAVPALVIAGAMVAIAMTIAVAILDLPLPQNPLLVVAGVVLGAAVSVPLALATANITRTVESAQVTSLPFMAIALLGAGTALPLEMLPDWAQSLIAITPTAPLVELIRFGWLGTDASGAAIAGSDLATAALRQVGILVVWFCLGAWFVSTRFRWEPRG